MARECHCVPWLCLATWKTNVVVGALAAILDAEALWGQMPCTKWWFSRKMEQVQSPGVSSVLTPGLILHSEINSHRHMVQRLISKSTHSSPQPNCSWATWTSDKETKMLSSLSSLDPTPPHIFPTHSISLQVCYLQDYCFTFLQNFK